ncbi:hypothetical protein NE398_20885 [Clostridium tertium]|uniref:Uncharacterized protein n=1 Tax=Clostridium tertium TaxID=1559 RepID=A0A9X3XSY7_9CLOT|nr:hypothetical protein [Clostridium tertium]MDC4242582.1 hypothetical protein [Clostridium tertium]
MNEDVLRLLEIIKIFNMQEVLEDEFNAFAEELEGNENVTLKELLDLAECEMSYWEND